MKKVLGIVFLFIGIFLVGYVLYKGMGLNEKNPTFSEYTLINASWEMYKNKFINPDGRVLDFSQNKITTSEGQSYALLRAVWVDDKETFDHVWQWTKDNLQREDNSLFGWKWGERKDGNFGYLEDGGENNATDADSDIALALIFASRRWNDESYVNDARPILNDIWEISTANAGGRRYLIAGNWAKNNEALIINPSYFSPYAYRIFSEVDREHDWMGLVDSSYELLNRLSDEPLDKGKSVGLPPDWAKITVNDGIISETNLNNLTTNYSFDAMRVPWRVALDFHWNGESRAKDYLSKMQFLVNEYDQKGKLPGGYYHDGSILHEEENPIMYSTVIGLFSVIKPELSQKLYSEKILPLYSNNSNSFNEDIGYYEQNWLWFGAALEQKYLGDFKNEE
jgi:endoglucanase